MLGRELARTRSRSPSELADERGARIVRAGPDVARLRAAAPGTFQRNNFALARAAAGRAGRRWLEPNWTRRPRRPLDRVPRPPGGRRSREPLTVFDGAHNPARRRRARRVAAGESRDGPLALVIGVLDDKDAAAMLGALLPAYERAFFTAPPGAARCRPPRLQSLARQLGFILPVEPRPARAVGKHRAGRARQGAACWPPGRYISSVTAGRTGTGGAAGSRQPEGGRG